MSAVDDAILTLQRPGVSQGSKDKAERVLREHPAEAVPKLLEARALAKRRHHRWHLGSLACRVAHDAPAVASANQLGIARLADDADLKGLAIYGLNAVPTPWSPELVRALIGSLALQPWQGLFDRLRPAGAFSAETLAPMLGSKQPLARTLALRALTDLGDPQTPALLREAAEHTDPRVRAAAWRGLAHRPASPEWFRSHPEPDPRLRPAWLQALGHAFHRHPDPWALSQLDEALESLDLPTLRQALFAFRKLDERCLSAARRAGGLSAPEPRDRLLYASALGQGELHAAARAALLAAAERDDPRVRVLVIAAMEEDARRRRRGPSRLHAGLPVWGHRARGWMLEDPEAAVRWRAWRLWRVSGVAEKERRPSEGYAWRARWPQEAMKRLAEVLCGGAPGVQALAPHLRCGEPGLRAAAVKLLEHPVQPGPTRDALLDEARRDPSRRVRVVAPKGG